MTEPAPERGWPAHVARFLRTAVIDGEEHLDATRRRLHARLGLNQPRHIAAYRSFDDGRVVQLAGRVLADPPLAGPGDDDAWWDNLLDTYRRFASREVPGAALRVRFRDAEAEVTTDAEGYYRATLQPSSRPCSGPWDNAAVSLADGTLLTPQPVLQVPAAAGVGIISDIDDTVLHSSITDWKTAAQLTFLHNARTRKPLQGVAALYQALRGGPAGGAHNPLFYVSSSPWNLYDLLDDFIELNGLPAGPIFLRDLGLDATKFIKSEGHGHKLERVRDLVGRMPHLRWVLLGDSGQADAELYAEAAREFGERIVAIYIRDVDPADDSDRDAGVDGHIESVAGTGVPMLRAPHSHAMAVHAAALGLVAPGAVPAVDREIRRDQVRPTLGQAATDDITGSAEA